MLMKMAVPGRRNGAFHPGLTVLVLMLLSMACSHRSVDDYLKAGDQAVSNSRPTEAESDYQQASKMAPEDPRPLVALGTLYLLEHKLQPGQAELMKALELAPHDAKAHASLAAGYEAAAEPGLAEAQYRAAVALSPADPAYRLSLGTTLQKEQKFGAAEAEYRTAIGLAPRNAHAHLALAALLGSEPNRQAEAQAEYAQVKALDPSLMPTGSTATVSLPLAANSPAMAAGSAAEIPALKDLNKRFLLTHDSAVYESMSNGARIVGQVHRGKWVHVTGLAGPWLRIRLRRGTVGFIPATSAE